LSSIFFKIKADETSLAEPEQEEEALSSFVPEADPEVERANPADMCRADASKVNDGPQDLNEILLQLNVCPDEIEEDSDEAYESDFEDD